MPVALAIETLPALPVILIGQVPVAPVPSFLTVYEYTFPLVRTVRILNNAADDDANPNCRLPEPSIASSPVLPAVLSLVITPIQRVVLAPPAKSLYGA